MPPLWYTIYFDKIFSYQYSLAEECELPQSYSHGVGGVTHAKDNQSANGEPMEQPANQSPFKITLIKSSDPGKVYAKNHETKSVNLPYFNQFTTVATPTFEALYTEFRKLIKQSTVTQILGAPTDAALKEQANSLPVRRTKQNFDFYTDPDVSSASIPYNYVALDIDNLPEQLYHPEFKEAYNEQRLTEHLLGSQVNLILHEIFGRPDIPAILRLSGSFGTHEKPKFKGHVFVPLTALMPVEDISLFLARFGWIDITPYRNPTQPLFTSGPICQSEDLDPLSVTRHNIPRLCMFNKLDSPVDPSILYSLLNTAAPKDGSQVASLKNRGKHTQAHASMLPGLKGVFNRAAESDSTMSVRQVLSVLGYTSENNSRYLSPNSGSDLPGAIIFPDGFLVDFHDNSPVNELASEHDPRPVSSTHVQIRRYSAYDLHFLLARSKDELKQFKAKVKHLSSRDPIYQSYWEKEIQSRMSYIIQDMTASQIEPILQGLVDDIFYAGLTGFRRQTLFDEIVAKVKDLKLKGVKVTKASLHDMYSTLRKKLSIDQLDVHPANPAAINMRALNELVVFSRIPKSTGTYLMENEESNRLQLLTSQTELESRLFRVINKLTTDEGWTSGKIRDTIEYTVRDVNSTPDHKIEIKTSPHVFSFKPEKYSDPLVGYNIRTHQQINITLQDAVLHQLPFTQDEFNNKIEKYKNTPFGETVWGKFLTDSLEEPEKINYLRQFMSYLFLPERKAQIILALIGVTRSGKSTIKNLLTELLPRPYSIEKSPKTLGTDLSSLHDLTSMTRLLVVNEFNAQEISRSKALGQIVNELKSMSGRDEVTTRSMRENVTGTKTDALPLLISNELPTITDSAFQSRLHLIKFNKSFPSGNDVIFQQSLLEELPYIFNWAITNPKIQHVNKPYKTVAIELKRPTGTMKVEKDQLAKDMNLIGYFIRSYFVEDPEGWVSKKDFKHYYCCFFQNETGSTFTDETKLNQLGLPDFRNIFPQTKALLSSKTRQPIVPAPGIREWGISGIRWRDPDGMTAALSEFAEFLE